MGGSAHGDFITGFLELSNIAGYNDDIGSFLCKETSSAFAQSCRSTGY